MFKQLETFSVVELLEPLEDHSLDINRAESLHGYIQEVERRIVAVWAEIKNIELV